MPLALDLDAAIAMRAVLEEKKAHDEARESAESAEPGTRTVEAEEIETVIPGVRGLVSF